MAIDCITDLEIPSGDEIIVKEGDETHTFDFRTLVRCKDTDGKYISPFTRSPLPRETVEILRTFLKRKISIQVKFSDGDFTMEEPLGITLGYLIIDIVLKMAHDKVPDGQRQSITHFMFMEYRLYHEERDLFELDLNEPIVSLFSGEPIVLSVKTADTPSERKGYGMRLHKLYRFASRNGWDTLKGLIPQKYHDEPGNPYTLHVLGSIISLMAIRESVLDFEFDEDTADELLEELCDLYISSELAHAFVETLDTNPTLKPFIMKVKHVLYSRVVDKHNLEFRDIEGQYYRDEFAVNDRDYFKLCINIT